jgi:hypothetical protein
MCVLLNYCAEDPLTASYAHEMGDNSAVCQWPNPSIERTFQSLIRSLWPAAHVERQAP